MAIRRCPGPAVALIVLLISGGAIADEVSVSKPNPLFEQALSLLKKGDLKGADALFAKLLAADPEFPQALLGRAQIAIDQQRIGDANRAVEAVVAKQPALPEAHNMRGVVLLAQNRPLEARQAFEKAISLRPTYVTPHVYVAAIKRSTNDLEGAAADYKGLTAMAPRLATGYLGQTEALFMMRRDAEAFAVFDKWRAADPNNPLPCRVLANVYLGRGQLAEAKKELDAAVKAFPNDSPLRVLLGDAYLAGGDPKAALQSYQKATALDPASSDAALKVGTTHAQLGDLESAKTSFRSVLQREPQNAAAANNLAWLLAESGRDLDEALRLAGLATMQNPEYVDAQDTLGWVRYRRSEYGLAVTVLERAKKLAPKRADIAAHLGLAYAKAGKADLAIPELRRALEHPEQVGELSQVKATLTQLTAPR